MYLIPRKLLKLLFKKAKSYGPVDLKRIWKIVWRKSLFLLRYLLKHSRCHEVSSSGKMSWQNSREASARQCTMTWIWKSCPEIMRPYIQISETEINMPSLVIFWFGMVKNSKSQKKKSWNSIAQKSTKMFDRFLP